MKKMSEVQVEHEVIILNIFGKHSNLPMAVAVDNKSSKNDFDKMSETYWEVYFNWLKDYHKQREEQKNVPEEEDEEDGAYNY